MKNIFILLSFLCLNAFSQEKLDTTNLYFKSLKLHVAYLESTFKNNNVSFPDNINVEYNEQTTINLPSQIDNFKISYLNRDEIKKLSSKESIQLIVIRPAVINAKSIIINVIDFNVKFRKNNFSYSNGGGSKIEFVYDCVNDCFKIGKIKQGGI